MLFQLIYKTYKDRLTSLDVSLSVLQRSTTNNSKMDERTAIPQQPTLVRRPAIPLPRESSLGQSEQPSTSRAARASSPDSATVTNHHPNTIRRQCQAIDVAEVSETGGDSGKGGRSFSVPRHTSFLSTPQQGNLSSPMSHRPTEGSMQHDELTHSLVSIDTQLHQVLRQLDVDNNRSAHALNHPRAFHGRPDAIEMGEDDERLERALQSNMANLSLSARPSKRGSIMGKMI